MGIPLSIPIIFSIALLAIWLWIERGRIILPGTWPALKWLGLRRVVTLGWHGILYGRWTVQYVGTVRKIAAFFSRWKAGRTMLFSLYADRYHGKIIPLEQARNIITIDRDIPLRDLGESVIPFSRARDIVLQAGDDLALFQCSCKTSSPDPCRIMEKPYNSCILIGRVLVDFLVSHNPDISRRISRDEALGSLDHFHEIGLVQCAWFKDALRDQMYVICNCCPCCCLGFHSTRLGVRQIASSGYVAEVDPDACRGCGQAMASCPFGAIEIVNGTSRVDEDKCMGCGVCVSRCPGNARRLRPDTARGAPLDVSLL